MSVTLLIEKSATWIFWMCVCACGGVIGGGWQDMMVYLTHRIQFSAASISEWVIDLKSE